MKNKHIQALCEASLSVALAFVLSYLKIPIGMEFGGFGGSIDFVMIPLILCGYRWGIGWGLAAGALFGTLKYFFAGGFAITWASMLLDYSLAYMAVGLSGIFKRKPKLAWLDALIGCSARFIIHFISGITIYKEYMYDIFGWPMTNIWVYSALYNATYMLPNTIVAVVLVAIICRVAPIHKG